jgi:nucleoside-diphosphate-sugar epimerase
MYVEDGNARALPDTANAIAHALGVQARIVRVPKLILTIAATIAETSAKLRNRPLLLTRDKVRDLTQAHWVCDSTPFRDATGWTHRIGFEEGVERTVHDYRQRGWIK